MGCLYVNEMPFNVWGMEMGWLHIEVTFDVLALKMSWMG
jgi:hypothetical protein